MSKPCNICGVIQPFEDFRKYTKGENSYSCTCKICLNELDKERKMKMRRDKSETSLVKCDQCGEVRPLKNFAKLKKFYKKKICKTCYPKFLTDQKTDWCRRESISNMNYRIKKSLAARLRTVMTKKISTMEYIGCNIQYLREWFEYNFTSEMTWENYGSYWSIDHIIPVNKFDLTIEEDKLRCWNWSNMMPVTVKFNSTKKEINMDQIHNIIKKLEQFKEEGSTTKWFSGNFILNEELALQKCGPHKI